MDILRQIKKDLYYMEVYDMSDFFQDVFNKTKKFANNAVDETKDAAQKAKLNNKISNEVQMIDRNMLRSASISTSRTRRIHLRSCSSISTM